MSLPSPTKAQSRRMEIIKRDIGCIACHISLYPGTPADAHHLLSGGRRISHDATIPLCKMHHDRPGGSIHKNKLWFAKRFGTDEYLLAETDRLVDIFEANTVGRS